MSTSIRNFTILVMGIIIFSRCAHFRKGNESNPDQIRKPAGYDLNYPSTEADLSLTELRQLLQKYKFSKIADLLAYLKNSKPEYMSHYALGYGSKSLHESSYENPRAIVYGKSARLIITFNGSKDQRAYEMLEVMHFNEDRRAFEFYEIEFNEKGQLRNRPYRISQNGGPERKCLACLSNFRPIWNHYDIWPGFFGSSDDFPFETQGKSLDNSTFDRKIPPKVALEWEHFKNTRMNEGRYQYLMPLARSSFGLRQDSLRPNTDLNAALFSHNMKRIERILEENGASGPIRHGLLYALFCEPALAPNSKIAALKSDFEKEANSKTLEHTASTLLEHAKELGYDWKELMETLIQGYPDRDLGSSTPEEFFMKVAEKDIGHLRPTKAQFPFLLSLVDKFMPQARVETWPMQFYTGIYRFDYGGDIASVFEDAVIRSAFGSNPSEADANLIKALKEARRAYYGDLSNYRNPNHPLKEPCDALYQERVLALFK